MICRAGLLILTAALFSWAQQPWRWGVEGNDWRLERGRTVKELKTPDGLLVRAGEPFRESGHYLIDITILNRTGQRLDVLPETFTLVGAGKGGQSVSMAYSSPDNLARGIEKGARRRNALDRALAEMSVATRPSYRTTGRATDGRGNTIRYSEQTYDDDANVRAAAERSRERARAAGTVAGAISTAGMRAETLMDGQSVFGLVAFKRAKGVRNAALEMPVGQWRISFPVELPK